MVVVRSVIEGGVCTILLVILCSNITIGWLAKLLPYLLITVTILMSHDFWPYLECFGHFFWQTRKDVSSGSPYSSPSMEWPPCRCRKKSGLLSFVFLFRRTCPPSHLSSSSLGSVVKVMHKLNIFNINSSLFLLVTHLFIDVFEGSLPSSCSRRTGRGSSGRGVSGGSHTTSVQHIHNPVYTGRKIWL